MEEVGFDSLFVRDLIVNSAESMCLFDAECKIELWNDQFKTETGLSSVTIENSLFYKLFPVFAQPDAQKDISKAISGKGLICERLISVAGSLKWYKISFTPIFNANDQLKVLAIFREEKRGGIDKSENKFKSLFDASPIATSVFRVDGTAKYFNKAFGDIWGAKSGTKYEVIDKYNILKDQQLIDFGVIPFIQKGFQGISCDLPPIPYEPKKTQILSHLEFNNDKYVKGSLFPINGENGKLTDIVLVLTDVTYQKQAEEILTKNHMKLRMLTSGLPGVIYEYHIKKRKKSFFKYISEGCRELFDVSPEEVMEDENLLMDKIHPDDLKSFIQSSKESNKAFTGWYWLGRIIVNDQIKWIEGKSSSAKMMDGAPVRYGLLLDVTESKQVEERHKLTEERLQLALEGAEIGLWEWDSKIRKTIFNKNWEKQFGYEIGELDKSIDEWAKLIHPDELPVVRENLLNHLSGKSETYEAQYRLKTESGEYRWILDKGKAIERDETGRVTKATGTYLDIDDKKRSKLLIKKNELLFTQLFDNSPIGIVMLDEKHNVIQMNRGFESIFGFREFEIIGKQLNNIIIPDELIKEAKEINLLTACGNVGKFETFRLNKAGDRIPVIIYSVPVSLDNKTIGIYGIYVDITERKLVENELQIRNNELDNFVYKVSHDLRAPLSSILGLVNLANIEHNEDNIKDYVKLIESRIKQLDNFINDVLSHSKNLKLDVTYAQIDFSTLIDKCFEDLSYLSKAKKLEREVTISDYPFCSDQWRVNEIFRNLVSNAIKYLDPSSEDAFVKIDISIDEKQAEITIKDNGIGISKDTVPYVFDMFYRATEHAEGSGIGLYIVKNAIDKLGGTIEIESEADKGTSFKIVLPNAQESIVN